MFVKFQSRFNWSSHIYLTNVKPTMYEKSFIDSASDWIIWWCWPVIVGCGVTVYQRYNHWLQNSRSNSNLELGINCQWKVNPNVVLEQNTSTQMQFNHQRIIRGFTGIRINMAWIKRPGECWYNGWWRHSWRRSGSNSTLFRTATKSWCDFWCCIVSFTNIC